MDLFAHADSTNTENYERRIVKDLCSRMGLPTPPPKAGFDWFYEQGSGFPARLACGRFPYVHALTFQDLVGSKFLKTPFIGLLEQVCQDAEPEDSRGSVVVFPWTALGLAGCEMMCVHDIERFTKRTTSIRFSRKMADGTVVCLQTLRSLVGDLDIQPQ